ncbi:MAG: hypothetical protein IPK19_32020 [Chloroflexi bacterium]|nr:hypothetical protein [Chloroflexota bacterium]
MDPAHRLRNRTVLIEGVMDTGIFTLLTIFMTAMVLMIQRTEKKRRLLVTIVMLLVAELIRRYVWYRGVHDEAWMALALALTVNFLFWMFIGRYNPVGSSEEIQVMGLDD